ncbi:hypothetical protein BsWGS_05657 [Bradybaena similaris]
MCLACLTSPVISELAGRFRVSASVLARQFSVCLAALFFSELELRTIVMLRVYNFGTGQIAILLLIFIAFLGISYIYGRPYIERMHVEGPVVNLSRPEQPPDAVKYRLQRNEISRQLNLMKQAYGQQSCEQLKLLQAAGKLKGDTRVSENGGWCAEASAPNSSSHMMDKNFAKAVSKFLKGKVVASFGDGPGTYKKYIDSLQEVISYTAYDGAPYCETVTGGVVKFLDLSAPQYGLEAYDWVMSLEVGEHIPAKYENIFLDNLARHAKEGIILSWAVPGQGGLSHVNNKALVDVVAQMNKRGFDISKEDGEPLRNAASFSWLKNNVHVYYRINKATFVPENV